ncbi:LLM class flavin-dependent oxidoreductase [Iamia majanohamensis]|uniref:LLM class flavin-dependent oxidoreductase n=1 Tax=Iamia majanohamensis TaxID=467976 RepID=A0AAE9YA04_9ACTN|nr:LLM class flavin-dependent oxidoreductase [Iamia majanohamensis]WCO67293.1 LLM class flavin-dependent oxidoreductase [Iamia majanohamensis]
MSRPALSILDLAVVGRGSSPADALAASTRLAQEAERLGYHRLWVAEHHSMPGIASSAPAVLIAHLAAATTHLRLGSGGVMLPNHSPLVVAEQFGMLEALHPGRIDLGLGRAPGTDQVTAAALRRTTRLGDGNEFPELLGELLGYFNGTIPDDHPFHRIRATPGLGDQPAVWLLGSSDYSARLAGRLGLPFSFAHHFAAGGTDAAVAAYRDAFQPSDVLAEPYLMLGTSVLCAPTDEEARYLAGPSRLAIVRLRQGAPDVYPTPEEAAAHDFSPAEQAAVDGFARGHVVGSPDTVREGLDALVARTGADELMVTTMAHGVDDRLRSVRMVAEAMGVTPVAA